MSNSPYNQEQDRLDYLTKKITVRTTDNNSFSITCFKEFGRELFFIRQRLGLSQNFVAEKLNISRAALSLLEHGNGRLSSYILCANLLENIRKEKIKANNLSKDAYLN